MNKRVWIICFLALCALLGGCGSTEIHPEATPQATQAAVRQEPEPEKTVAAIPGLEEEFKNVSQIEFTQNLNPPSQESPKPMLIKDPKMVRDIVGMVTASSPLTDESKFNNMSGMASQDNKVVLTMADGGKKELTFSYDSLYEVGYINLGNRKIEPDYSFFRYMRDLSEYPKPDINLDTQVIQLFRKYHWTVDYRISALKETLPQNLKHGAGDYPVKIYWAYNNELSKSIGLDLAGFLGRNVDVEIYRLREPLPEYMKPRLDARGIVVKCDGKIIGAYIDAGRHDSFACSLDRKRMEDLTNKDWNTWVKDYIDYDSGLEKKLAKMKPEELIKTYYEALDAQDETLWAACMTRKALCNYLTSNLDNNLLFHKNFDGARFGGKSNVKAVKLVGMKELKGMDNPKGTLEYEVTIDLKVREVITCDSGVQPRFLILKKEAERSGWRVEGEGTGP